MGIANARVDRGVKIKTLNGALRVGDGVAIGRGTRIAVVAEPGKEAELTVGKGTRIGAFCVVNAQTSVSIGENCEISWKVQILDSDFHTLRYSDGTSSQATRPVSIGNHVLIGTGAIILKGVSIGDGAVVGAGAVVVHDVAPDCVAVGNPAKTITDVTDWL